MLKRCVCCYVEEMCLFKGCVLFVEEVCVAMLKRCVCCCIATVIQVVSGMNLVVEGYLGGIRTAWLSPQQNGMKTGLVLCPNSKSLVLNSTPGVLQFYDTATRKVTEVSNTGTRGVTDMGGTGTKRVSEKWYLY